MGAYALYSRFFMVPWSMTSILVNQINSKKISLSTAHFQKMHCLLVYALGFWNCKIRIMSSKFHELSQRSGHGLYFKLFWRVVHEESSRKLENVMRAMKYCLENDGMDIDFEDLKVLKVQVLNVALNNGQGHWFKRSATHLKKTKGTAKQVQIDIWCQSLGRYNSWQVSLKLRINW